MKLGRLLYFGDFIAVPLAVAAASAPVAGSGSAQSALIWLGALLAGGMLWTFIEYAVHAWVYHRLPWFRQAHAAHHDAPQALIGAPSLLIPAALLAIAYATLPWTGLAFCGGLASGLLAGYLVYITVHHLAHAGRGPALAGFRARHFAHHYRGGDTNFGVSVSWWDHVFATAAPVAQIKVIGVRSL